MAIRTALSPENRTIAVTGVGSNASGGSAFWWHTVVFEQNSTGSSCSLKSGWPVTWPGPHYSKVIYPEAVAIHSDNSVYVTGRTYHASLDIQYFTTIRYKAIGTNGGAGSGVAHWWYDWNAGAKDSCGKDIVLDRDGNAFAPGFVTPTSDHDYGTVRIPREWNMSDDIDSNIWDKSGRVDEAASIDLTYEVESGAIKVYAFVTGTTDQVFDDSDIGTLRYDAALNLGWHDVFTQGSYVAIGCSYRWTSPEFAERAGPRRIEDSPHRKRLGALIKQSPSSTFQRR